MCRDYRNTAFQSQHHCIESCAVTHAMQNNESYPSFMSALYEPLNMTYNPNIQSDRHKEAFAFCRLQCPSQSCLTNKYSPTSKRWNNGKKNVETKFILASSPKPKVHNPITCSNRFSKLHHIFLGMHCFLDRNLSVHVAAESPNFEAHEF